MPIKVAARAEARTVSVHLSTGVMGSNPTQGMDVSLLLFRVCAVMCIGSALATDLASSKESYRLCVRLRNCKIGRGPTTVKPLMNDE
jgi:hypothetical protein